MTTTDRELLQRAAKAAGMRAGNGPGEYAWHPGLGCLSTLDERNREVPWNPLHDDGDEARLEAACNIDIEWHTIGVVAMINDKDLISTTDRFRETYADHSGDKQKARRYAGVRAAAAMAGEGE